MSVNEMDLHLCPICGSRLTRGINFDNRGNLIVICENCGKYGMTAPYYEDEIESANEEDKKHVRSFLESHKSDRLKPLISYLAAPAPEGYKNCVWSQVAR